LLTLRNYLMKNILFYKRIKNYKLGIDLSSFQAFCDLSKECRVLSDYIIGIKNN